MEYDSSTGATCSSTADKNKCHGSGILKHSDQEHYFWNYQIK